MQVQRFGKGYKLVFRPYMWIQQFDFLNSPANEENGKVEKFSDLQLEIDKGIVLADR